MTEVTKKYEHLIPIISDKIRVLQMEILEETDVNGFWMYKIVYFKEDEILEEHVIGQDMSDALYRLGKLIEMPFARFPSYLNK